MSSDITVCIATIPPRRKLLREAVASVKRQTLQPDEIVIERDTEHTGAAATKNRALARVTTKWVAFLDDDDAMMQDHLELLLEAALEHEADVVYSRPYIPQIADHEDPCGRHGLPFDAEELRKRSYIQTTSLVRTELARQAGGFQVVNGTNYDDWGFYIALLDLDAKFYHVNIQTFVWNHWGYGQPGKPGNTSGRSDRW